jgi:hypothetical protein
VTGLIDLDRLRRGGREADLLAQAGFACILGVQLHTDSQQRCCTFFCANREHAMPGNEEHPKEVEGEVDRGEAKYESLRSAREHLTAAADDVKRFVDQDFARLAKGAVDRLDETVTSGIANAADAMIEALEDLKQRLKKQDRKDS